MINKLIIISILFVGLILTRLSPAEEPHRSTAITASVVLKVISVEDVRKKILEETQKDGGFRVLVTDKQLCIKLPPKKLFDFLQSLGTQGLVMKKTIDRKDLTQQIAQLEGALRSKKEIFTHLEKLIDQSDLVSTLNIEKTMGELMGEIEQAKGELRVKKDQVRWALIDISFKFRARQQVVYVNSPFEWLNSVDLTRLVEGF